MGCGLGGQRWLGSGMDLSTVDDHGDGVLRAVVPLNGQVW